MDEVDKGCPMTRMGVSGWVFLLVPASSGSPGPAAVKWLCVCVCYFKYTEQLQLLKRVLLQASAVDGERKPKLTNKKRKLGDGKQKLKLARPIRPKVAAHALRPPSTVCFTCGEDSGGETARCARGQCGKIYHIACLNLADKPPGYIRLVFLTENYCRTRLFRVHLIFAIRVASRN